MLTACEEETERVGCTDWRASNFDANAQVDDGSCLLPDDMQQIFLDGQFGGWDGDSLSAGYVLTSCKGAFQMVTITGDSTSTTALGIMSDSNGEYNLAIQLVNPVDAGYYGDGSIKFDIQKGIAQNFPTFDTYIYGNNAVTDGTCWQQRRSDFTMLSALSLSDTAFSSVSIPLPQYSSRAMNGLTVVFGISGEAQPDQEVMLINDLRWTVD